MLKLNTLVFSAGVAAAALSILIAPSLDRPVAAWAVSGVGLAALLRYGPRSWAGLFCANLLVHALLEQSGLEALAIATAATLGPVLAGWLFRRGGVDATLGTVRDIARYAALACPQGLLVPLAGILLLTGSGALLWTEAWELWLEWTFANLLAVFAITPLLLWLHDQPGFSVPRRTELLLSFLLLMGVTALCYSLTPPVGYPVLLVLVLIAVRQAQREVALAMLAVILVALGESMHREWLPFAGAAPSNLRVLGFLVFASAGSLLLGALVTESRRKDAQLLQIQEDRLKQSEARFEDAFEASPQGMAISGLDGRWLKVNAALCSMLGYSQAELMATNFQAVTHPDDLAKDEETMRAFMAGEQSTAQFEKRYIHRSGKLLVVVISVSLARDAAGAPLHYVTQVMDVTDRKRAEELWRFGLEGAGDVVWDWDIPTDETRYSGRVLELLGCLENDLPRSQAAWRNLIHPDDLGAATKRMAAMLERPGQAYASEHRLRCADGSWKRILSRGLVMSRDRDDKPLRAVGTIVDITEMQKLQERLHQSDKMSALGQLSGGVAHDINNDLGVIVGSAELILDAAPAGSREEVLAARIVSTVRRSMDLVRRMLAFSRQADSAPQRLELAGFLRDFLDTLGRTLGAGIQTRILVSDPNAAYWVELDRSLLESSLINLSTNARDAMPGGGVLGFSLSAEPGAVLLAVSDTGTGMSEEVRRRLFEPFFTTKPVGGGTGLGLPLVYGFLQQCGGAIEVESTPGSGTRFLLRFPSATAPVGEAAAPQVQPAPVAVRAVLLVDDNRILRQTLQEQLVALGCVVHAAGNFQEAVALVEAGLRLDFVLSDYDLGGGPDGVALAWWLHDKGRTVPGTIMSGYLKSFPRLPARWQSTQKPLQQAALRAMLTGLDSRAAPPSLAGILVVEDSDDMRFITAQNLRRAGHKVAEAATAKEALGLAEQDTGLRLAICDIGLPDMRGGQLAAELRQRHPGLKVVLMSGGQRQPGEKILRKPFTREALLRFVEDALAQEGERNA